MLTQPVSYPGPVTNGSSSWERRPFPVKVSEDESLLVLIECLPTCYVTRQLDISHHDKASSG